MHAQIATIKLQAVSRSAPLDKAAAANSAVRVGLIIAPAIIDFARRANWVPQRH
jgi:hypothetical protein